MTDPEHESLPAEPEPLTWVSELDSAPFEWARVYQGEDGCLYLRPRPAQAQA